MSNAVAALDAFQEAEQKQRAKADLEYWTRVRAAAKGEQVDPAKLLAFLPTAGRTPDDFKRDVGFVVRRIDLAAQLAAFEADAQEAATLKEQLKEYSDELARVRQEMMRKTEPLALRVRFIEQKAANKHYVHTELFDIRNCPYPAVAERVTRARGAVVAAEAVVTAARKKVEFQRQYIETEKIRAKKTTSLTVEAQHLADAAGAEALLPALLEKVAEARAAHDRALAARDQAEAELLVP